MAELYIQAVMITPNPVNVKAQFKIEVEMYTLFPAAALYPALDLSPGVDLFGLYPREDIYQGTDVYPIEGGMSE